VHRFCKFRWSARRVSRVLPASAHTRNQAEGSTEAFVLSCTFAPSASFRLQHAQGDCLCCREFTTFEYREPPVERVLKHRIVVLLNIRANYQHTLSTQQVRESHSLSFPNTLLESTPGKFAILRTCFITYPTRLRLPLCQASLRPLTSGKCKSEDSVKQNLYN